MELVTKWEYFNIASLVFCQVQGMIGILIITGIAIFKYNLGEALSKLREKGGVLLDKI